MQITCSDVRVHCLEVVNQDVLQYRIALHGSHTQFPLQGLSAKQDAVALSTPEAEWYAGCAGG